MHDFDIAILPRWDSDPFQARTLAAASAAKVIVGFDTRRPDFKPWERAESALLSQPINVETSEQKHELEHGKSMAAGLGLKSEIAPRVGDELPTKRDRAAGQDFLAQLTRRPETLIAVALGAGANRRLWPPEFFAEALASVSGRVELGIVMFGGHNDRSLAARFRNHLPSDIVCLDGVGSLSLRESIAVLGACDLFLGGDSGPLHMACSVGLPAVVISCHPAGAPTSHENSPNRFGPWPGTPSAVARPQPLEGCKDGCVKNEAHCVLNVTVDAVSTLLYEALCRELGRQPD